MDRPAPARKVLTRRQRENRAGLAYLSPTLIVVLVVVVLPILWTVMLAFQRIRLINVRRAGVCGEYTLDNLELALDRERVVQGKSGDLGGRRISKKKNTYMRTGC